MWRLSFDNYSNIANADSIKCVFWIIIRKFHYKSYFRSWYLIQKNPELYINNPQNIGTKVLSLSVYKLEFISEV